MKLSYFLFVLLVPGIGNLHLTTTKKNVKITVFSKVGSIVVLEPSDNIQDAVNNNSPILQPLC